MLDSVGVGALPDAAEYGDEQAHTLGHILESNPDLQLFNLNSLGLGHVTPRPNLPPLDQCRGAFGILTERSKGKDTITGHWEIAGLVLDKPFKTFPQGFPRALIEQFEREIGRKTLVNRPASGTEIIDAYGEEHVRTGFPIIYTSADSVFQIAVHEEIVPIEQLYDICGIARRLCHDEFLVARIIARPFLGRPGHYYRTERRRDFALPPPSETVLDFLSKRGLAVLGIGKIEDIFQNRGLTKSNHTGNNQAGMEAIIDSLSDLDSGLIFANLVDFDMQYGHRRDAVGYGRALHEFDQWLPRLMTALGPDDLLIITADHGCDPTIPGTDHTREYVPVLAWYPELDACIDLGTRSSFTDIAQTIADFFYPGQASFGTSFLDELYETHP